MGKQWKLSDFIFLGSKITADRDRSHEIQRCLLLGFSKTDTGLQHVYPLIFPLPTPDDFRIFCGDLGNEVNDDILARAFSRFPSFLKAKVIRDKRTGKTKGYGFVSFKDPSDYVRAMREMNGECGLP